MRNRGNKTKNASAEKLLEQERKILEKVVDEKMCKSSKDTILTRAIPTIGTKFSDKRKINNSLGFLPK